MSLRTKNTFVVIPSKKVIFLFVLDYFELQQAPLPPAMAPNEKQNPSQNIETFVAKIFTDSRFPKNNSA